MCSIEQYYSKSYIQQLINQSSFEEVASLLQKNHPGKNGFSERSLRRFCSNQGISFRNSMCNDKFDQVVLKASTEVGDGYGRKMMTGYLKTKGIYASEKKVGKALKRINPVAQQTRTVNAGRALNPQIYRADYFGNKLHFDQNEKLVMFGVTHVCCRDGYSGLIVAHSTMPIKNNIRIYEDVYRQALLRYGLWDQIRVDGGKEFVLICHAQEMLEGKRQSRLLTPYKSTKSTDNQIIERIWVEVNRLVNYPTKRIMSDLVHHQLIDMTDDTTKYCVSAVLITVLSYGMDVFVESWNNHRIQGKGIPYSIAHSNNQCAALTINEIPSTAEAVSSYSMSGGSLTERSCFGKDPLELNSYLKEQRENTFFQYFNSKMLFEDIQKNGNLLHEAIKYYIYLTNFYAYTTVDFQ